MNISNHFDGFVLTAPIVLAGIAAVIVAAFIAVKWFAGSENKPDPAYCEQAYVTFAELKHTD